LRAGLIILAGCGEELFVRLDVPIEDRHRSVLIAAGADPEAIHARAIAGGTIDPLRLPAEDGAPIHALLYERSLEELGLSADRVERRDDGRLLPRTMDVFQSTPFSSSAWLPVAFPAGLETFRYTGDDPCVRFEERLVIPLGGAGAVTDLWPLDGAVLAAVVDRSTGTGRLLRVSSSGVVEALADGPRIFSGYRDGDGVYWFGGHGEILSGRIGSPMELARTSTPSLTDEIRVLEGDELGAGPGVQFAVTQGHAIERFDGSWTVLEHFDPGLGCIYGAARISDDEAVIGFEDALVVSRWKRGQLTTESVPGSNLNNGVSAARHIPGLGTALGTQIGEILLYRDLDPRWVKVEGTYATIAVFDLEPYEGGFLYVDERSVFLQYVEGVGYCAPNTPSDLPGVGMHSIAAVGRDVVVGGEPGSLGQPHLFWFTGGTR
jgi:hypothetical protein